MGRNNKIPAGYKEGHDAFDQLTVTGLFFFMSFFSLNFIYLFTHLVCAEQTQLAI